MGQSDPKLHIVRSVFLQLSSHEQIIICFLLVENIFSQIRVCSDMFYKVGEITIKRLDYRVKHVDDGTGPIAVLMVARISASPVSTFYPCPKSSWIDRFQCGCTTSNVSRAGKTLRQQIGKHKSASLQKDSSDSLQFSDSAKPWKCLAFLLARKFVCVYGVCVCVWRRRISLFHEKMLTD